MEWDTIIEIDDIAPSVNSAYFFLKAKTGRIIKVKNTKAKEWVEYVKNFIPERYNKYTEEQVEVSIQLYFTDDRRHDVDNYQKITLDALTGILWYDDTQIKKITIEKFERQMTRKTIIKVRLWEDVNEMLR